MSGPLTTSVPMPTFGDNGFVAPAESAILAGRLADINAAFGGALNTTNLATPQGQLASSDAAILGDAYALLVQLLNGVDPAYASGRMQDGIARIYFLERNPASATVIEPVCNGASGTIISAGASLQASDGNQYVCTGGGTIPSSGSITLAFACTVTGPIACPPQTFTIMRTVPGWDSATSVAAGTPGANVENRAAFEARRRQSVAINAQNSADAIRGAVLAVPGVIDAYVIENVKSMPVEIGGVTLAPHSIYVSVVGGDATQIATAIWQKKSCGCDYNGNTTVTISDTNGFSPPYPAYSVSFEIPAQTPVSFSVAIANGPGVPSNATLLVRAAIVSAFSGQDGGARARIGSTIYASRFYAAVASLGAWAQVVSIQLGVGGSMGFSLTLPIDQVPVCSDANVYMNLV